MFLNVLVTSVFSDFNIFQPACYVCFMSPVSFPKWAVVLVLLAAYLRFNAETLEIIWHFDRNWSCMELWLLVRDFVFLFQMPIVWHKTWLGPNNWILLTFWWRLTTCWQVMAWGIPLTAEPEILQKPGLIAQEVREALVAAELILGQSFSALFLTVSLVSGYPRLPMVIPGLKLLVASLEYLPKLQEQLGRGPVLSEQLHETVPWIQQRHELFIAIQILNWWVTYGDMANPWLTTETFFESFWRFCCDAYCIILWCTAIWTESRLVPKYWLMKWTSG